MGILEGVSITHSIDMTFPLPQINPLTLRGK